MVLITGVIGDVIQFDFKYHIMRDILKLITS